METKGTKQADTSDGSLKQRLMTNVEAEAYLRTGQPVRLNNPLEFWFMQNNKLFVFTKEDKIFEPRAIEHYGQNDWQPFFLDAPYGIRFIKALRVQIDEIYQSVDVKIGASRELSLAKTELQLAFMHLGLVLARIDAENPYPQSMNPESPAIEKHADKWDGETKEAAVESGEGLNEDRLTGQTRIVKEFRLRIDIFYKSFSWFCENDLKSKIIYNYNALHYPPIMVDQHLVNAKLWLGQQLNNIRIEQEKLTTNKDQEGV